MADALEPSRLNGRSFSATSGLVEMKLYVCPGPAICLASESFNTRFLP